MTSPLRGSMTDALASPPHVIEAKRGHLSSVIRCASASGTVEWLQMALIVIQLSGQNPPTCLEIP
jgi:hypothetical protein